MFTSLFLAAVLNADCAGGKCQVATVTKTTTMQSSSTRTTVATQTGGRTGFLKKIRDRIKNR